MAARDVTHLPTTAPTEVELRAEELAAPRFTPRELRRIKEETGRSFTQLVADDESDEKLTVLAWLKLRREGFTGDLAELDDTVISLVSEPPDPTNAPAPTP
jgi:hypothetical protein